jgi:hypothetical protein
MNVKILKVAVDELVGATIMDRRKVQLPSIQDGWRFNFAKHSKALRHAETYVLIADDSPEILEGCLIFQMLDKQIPYMSFLEIAPHNQARPRRYDYIAGCLIAFAFKLSVLKGKGVYQAQLFFDVQEEHEGEAEKLIELYRKKYGALRQGDTTLVIIDDAGYKLISKYLERKFKD